MGAVEGSITALEPGEAGRSRLQLAAVNGRDVTVVLDRHDTVVWRAGQVIALSALATGQQVAVQYARRDGQDVATAITVLQLMPMARLPSQPAPAFDRGGSGPAPPPKLAEVGPPAAKPVDVAEPVAPAPRGDRRPDDTGRPRKRGN